MLLLTLTVTLGSFNANLLDFVFAPNVCPFRNDIHGGNGGGVVSLVVAAVIET